MKFLLEVTESYRVNSQAEVDSLIEQAKTSNEYALVKYNCQQKEQKQKGEIIDSWFKVSLTKRFNIEKEPDRDVSISYSV